MKINRGLQQWYEKDVRYLESDTTSRTGSIARYAASNLLHPSDVSIVKGNYSEACMF